MDSVLRVADARKSFGSTAALRGVSLHLGPGELLALLGPNGAGKTTLVRAISGRVRLDGGTIELHGTPLQGGRGRETLGVVPQEIALYPLLSARENLQAFGELNGLGGARLRDRIGWALDWTGLAERAKEPIRTFSGGMKRRLNIACGVLHEPSVVLLDEPTTGVDPQSRERIYEMLRRLREAGASLLLTTHLLEEAESLCDRIVILDHGQVIESGTLAELVSRTIGGARRVTLHIGGAPSGAIAGLENGVDGGLAHAQIRDVGRDLPALLERIAAAGGRVEDLEVRPPSLQSVFLHLTGRELRE
jgi:ABC-2 type transport system ATP-binding protein